VCLLLVLAGCARRSERAEPPGPPVVLDVEPDGRGRRSLALRLGNEWGRFLLDTGASSHVLSLAFMREAGVAPEGKRVFTSDFAGKRQDALLIQRLVGATREGALLELHGPIAQEMDRSEFDGILAPHLLAMESDVELDLRAGRLTLNAPYDPSAHEGVAERCKPFRNLSMFLIAPVEVEGRGVRMLVDTGITFSSVDVRSRLGHALLQASAPAGPVGIPGSVIDSRRALARVTFAQRTFPAELRLVDTTLGKCNAEGGLGTDLLAQCRLRFGPSGMAASCPELTEK
jgi:hypothetical protein